jgi:23S rRNA pseudouridine1911/1915/1917 synthase
MTQTEKHVLQAARNCSRLDVWLHQQFPDRSRSALQRLIRDKRVLVQGAPCTPNTTINIGDEIQIEFPPPEAMELRPEAISLKILFEDKHLLVLNKPPGMVVHPGPGHADHTLVHALLHHCKGQLSGIGGVERPGIVHRLDKDTSGCLVIAKSDLAHQRLSEAFQSREMEKIYLALVWGGPRFLSGHIDKPIRRHVTHRQRMAVGEDGKPARTDWKISERLGPVTLLECRLHSGRTHQIRVHLSSEGFPIVGDLLYGKPKDPSIQELAPRQMLHAWKLQFHHPILKKVISCEAPIPKDMQQLIKNIKSQFT